MGCSILWPRGMHIHRLFRSLAAAISKSASRRSPIGRHRPLASSDNTATNALMPASEGSPCGGGDSASGPACRPDGGDAPGGPRRVRRGGAASPARGHGARGAAAAPRHAAPTGAALYRREERLSGRQPTSRDPTPRHTHRTPPAGLRRPLTRTEVRWRAHRLLSSLTLGHYGSYFEFQFSIMSQFSSKQSNLIHDAPNINLIFCGSALTQMIENKECFL